MTNAIKALAQWKESIPQDGLLDFVLKVILDADRLVLSEQN